MERIKSEFADQFTRCLKAFYQGRLPSFAKIARDFSLRAPHLPHVSAETVRHWVRGSSIPHVSRMQVLVDWLGPEVAASFDNHARALLAGQPAPFSNQLISPEVRLEPSQQISITDKTNTELLAVLNLLTEEERLAVYEIAQLLVARHSPAMVGNSHLIVVTPNSDDPVEREPDA